MPTAHTATNYIILGERSRRKLDPEIVEWFTERGVSKKNAERFLYRSGCESVKDVSVYLRIKLAPLPLANVDCIHTEMYDNLGVADRNVFRIIKDLDIPSAQFSDTLEQLWSLKQL
jgi:hypothetical protein